jgi:type IV pilus assembly protein PilX
MSNSMQTGKHTQQGAILVISLLLLLILTILGLAVMRMTRMEERMAGNTRDMNLALQGAEAGLRDGETRIRSFGLPPPDVATAGCGLTVADVCQINTLPVNIDAQTDAWWSANAVKIGAPAATEIPELAADPRYTVEQIGIVRQTPESGTTYGVDAKFVYQISARSVGASGQANTVLQSTFVH